MEVTFEDFAHIVQDRRFEQAIGRAPEPEKAIKFPQKLDVEEFMKLECNSLLCMLSEPLGRFFLGKVADVTQVIEQQEAATIPRPTVYERDENGPQHQVLSFVEDWYNLKKRDPKGVTPLVDLIVLIEKHKLVEFFDTAMVSFKGTLSSEYPTTDTVNPESVADVEPVDIYSAQKLEKKTSYDNEIDYEFKDLKSKTQEKTDLNLDQPVRIQKLEEIKRVPSRNKEPPTISRIDTFQETEVHTVREPQQRTNIFTKSHSTLMVSESVWNNDESECDSTNKFMPKIGGLANASNVFDIHSLRTKDINERLEKKLLDFFKPLHMDLLSNEELLKEYIKFKHYSMRVVEEKDIIYHRLIGQGAFGSVHGCTIAQIGVVVAMKLMLKKKVKLKNAKNQVEAEKKTLKALADHPSPYCMSLRYAFQTKDHFHLILPLAVGGDLKQHLAHGKPLSPQRYTLYSAQIAYGLGHLHTLGFIMRDLKPRNVLLNSEGNCQISDFGLAVYLKNGMHKGRAGTEGYWSPEVLNNEQYGYDCDWWGYGCCLYELTTGKNPFSTRVTGLKNRNEGTISGEIIFPPDMNPHAKELVEKLLKHDKSERICTSRTGVDELMHQNDPFWSSLDLLSVRQGTHEAPWKPEKGKIYAAKQQEIAEHDDYNELRASKKKLKMKKEDEIRFDYYVDNEKHQKDLVKIIHINTKVPMLKKNRWDDGETIESPASGCGLCLIV